MSQMSNPYTSSLYEVENLDTLSYLPSDSSQVFTTESASVCQQTLTSRTVTSLPKIPLLPDSLERVGPDRKKEWVIYSNMTQNDFLSWWFDTQFGAKRGIRWDGHGHYSGVWKDFDMVAHYITGEAKVRCKRCGKILEHPNRKKDNGQSIGTKSLTRHIGGPRCLKSSNNAAKQPHIGKMIEKMVNYLPINYYSANSVF